MNTNSNDGVVKDGEVEREERTEFVSVYVSKSVAKQFKAAENNRALEEQIIKDFFTRERDWLESEMKEVDEATIKYKAKLIAMKESFSKANSSYVDEIEKIYDEGHKTITKIDGEIKKTQESLRGLSEFAGRVVKQISGVETWKIKEMLDQVERFNNMSTKQKDLILTLMENERSTIS